MGRKGKLFIVIVLAVIKIKLGCITPDGRYGQCTNFRKCDYIVQQIQQWSSTKDQNVYNYIWASVCNYHNGDADVCCASTVNSGFVFSPIGNSFTSGINFGNSNTNNVVAPGVGGGVGSVDNRCGVSNASQTRVVGGRPAQRNAYPWIAALMYQMDTLRQLCAGSLITTRHIISAAHCIKDNLQSVKLGAYDLSDADNGIFFDIEWKRKHENYQSITIQNDIGMIKITVDSPLDDSIRPICLPYQEPERSMDYSGYTPFVCGWGASEENGPASTILQEVQVPVVSREDCEYNYKLYFPSQVFDNRVFCAGATGKDSCQGDSGGPLMLPITASNKQYYYFVLIGIVSYGFQCGVPNFPGVYTRVSAFLPWIDRNIQS